MSDAKTDNRAETKTRGAGADGVHEAYESFDGMFASAPRNGIETPQIFKITTRSGKLDDLALQALADTAREFDRERGDFLGRENGEPFKTTTAACLAYIRQNGLSSQIGRLTGQLNKSGLDDTSRRLLATEGVYPYLILQALKQDHVKSDDLDGLRFSVLLHLADDERAPKSFLISRLVRHVLDKSDIDLERPLQAILRRELLKSDVSLLEGKVKPIVLSVLARVREDGTLPVFVDHFFNRQEIPPTKLTDTVRASMVKYLRGLNLNLRPGDAQKFEDGQFDEYFALAYDRAAKVSTGEQDPLALKFTPSGVATGGADWDFTVETFDTVEEQGIIKENILAAGALYYIHELGERLGIFKLGDALVLRWASGALDLEDGEAASRLYRLWKLRQERSSPEERALLYKRVLNIGEAKLLARMVVNEEFPELWHKLMEEVATYIQKTERSLDIDENATKVSRSPIYEATRNLQYNLTAHMTGMAHMQVREMYAHLRDVTDIISNTEIVDFFGGGRRKNMWQVIERLSMDEFQISPNIASIRTSAVEGNKVYQWIGNFDGFSTVKDDEFRSFLESAEAWILAQTSGGMKMSDADEEESDEVESDEDEPDGFEDWED